MDLEKYRSKIDRIDDQIIKLLNERFTAVCKIAEIKRKDNHAVFMPEAERELIDHLRQVNSGPMPDETLTAIYREVLSGALKLEQPLKISYFGLPGSYTNLAAIKKFGHGVEYISRNSISDVFKDIETGRVDYGCVPVENSTEGAVTHTLDMLVNSPALICAELNMPIHHNLLARCKREEIKKVYSHTQVLGQCRKYLNEYMPGVEQIIAASSTRAAQIAAEEDNAAVIGSTLAAELFGLNVLEECIEDFTGNTTRFLYLGKQETVPTGNDKTSICFAMKERVGILYESLKPFKDAKISLTMVESRPQKTANWKYVFFLDLIGHRADANIREALEKLEDMSTLFKVLGSYPRSI